ncbi:hypothetical protein SAMN05880582_101607 [Rhizobium sp. RU20A]|uniref:hypothetical protein n=1 Tax=Rhizobium sp. RU20A TaxID=1907412 RepID=UPI0009571685|nr:hypothetical protein [Rhizobium sp. RU20A]SIQ06921.1 hypothetical protein SAMN05880582_101607 [Rhizobium sp. RU20A]
MPVPTLRLRANRAPSSAAVAGLVLAALALTACQSKPPAAPKPSTTALATMERVALAANRCWFKAKDPAFADYRLAPELNSFSGRPRILIVPRHSPESRPLLVVQAEGQPAQVQAFGPLMSGASGARVNGDVARWAAGGQGC